MAVLRIMETRRRALAAGVLLTLLIIQAVPMSRNIVLNAATLRAMRASVTGDSSLAGKAANTLARLAEGKQTHEGALRGLSMLASQNLGTGWAIDALQVGLRAAADPLLLYRAGECYLAEGQEYAALAAWRCAGAAPAFLSRAEARYRAGDPCGALRDLAITSTLAPGASDPHYLAGRIHERQGDWDSAAGAYREAVLLHEFLWLDETSPDQMMAEAYTGWGYASYQAQGDLATAVGLLMMALDFAPEHGWALIRLCDVHRLAGDLPLALEWGARAVLAMPSEHWAYFSRGRAYAQAGDYDLARQDFEMALEIAPDYVLARDALAQLPGPGSSGGWR